MSPKGENGMHLYERPRGQNRGILFAVAVFALLAALLLVGLVSATRRSDARETEMVSLALQRAIVTCYAVEGKYPPSLTYIYDNYGVRVDESRYTVFYDVIAANVKPSVRVMPTGGGS
jgi:type II secretory pathway pseudopilin PulG